MRGLGCRRLLCLLLCAASLRIVAADNTAAKPPATRRDNVTETLHGVTITDPYRWLEEQNSPETRAWIDAQNSYTHSLIGSLPGRAQITRRLTELLKVDMTNTPEERGGRYFYTARAADQDVNVIHMKQGLNGKDVVLVDPHPWSADHSTSVGILGVSEDGRRMLYFVRRGGADEIEIRAYDVDNRADLPDRFEKALYSHTSFTPDANGFYYEINTEAGSRVRYHKMGTDPKTDTQIFGENYKRGIRITPDVSEDGHYLTLRISYGATGSRTELYLQDLTVVGAPIQPIIKDLPAHFDTELRGDTIFVRTNWKAPNGRVLAIDPRHPEQDRWHEIVPESDAAMESMEPVAQKLLIHYLRNATSQIKILNADGSAARELKLPSLGTVTEVIGRWKSSEVFYRFTSFTVPQSIYRYDASTGQQRQWAGTHIPLDPKKLEIRQVWYESKDKTRVPMFLIHAKGMKLDGGRPTVLTGYGGFTLSQTPNFRAVAVLLAERGGVYAVANLRGGGEFGEQWHRLGMLQNKQNVFDDFIAAGEWLVKNRYTSREKLAITGGSNGGLLVGAALTQRPDLFRAVVCSYPLLDMLRYHLFLVARYWVPEYGSSEDPEQFKYLYLYSPYHNVKAGIRYPAVLFVTGDSDTRVAPLHARKMTALLQASTSSDLPILLHYDTKAGHSQGRAISSVIEDDTDSWSFLFWQLGITGSQTAAAN
jgi:prolyl oligopeptidase